MAPFFNRLKPANLTAGLPGLSTRECLPLTMPNSNSLIGLDYGSLTKMAKIGLGTDYWIVKIYESEGSWKALSIDVDSTVLPIVRKACEMRNAVPTTEEEKVLLVGTSFGMLAGLYESSSNTTSAQLCHGFIWNSLVAFTQSCPAFYQSSSFHEANPAVFSNMPFLGYAVGKVPNLEFNRLFSRWV